MKEAIVRGARINFETFGIDGPWISLSPGSRKGLADIVPIATSLAANGFRVLLHDRRNCGASEVAFDATAAEHEIWADDLRELTDQLGIKSLYVGGASSGARLSIAFAIRHPDKLSGLLVWKITGGAYATTNLAEAYYGSFIALAKQGGMAAICDSEHFKACIESRPDNRARLMALDSQFFIGVMQQWQTTFLQSASLPVIGATEKELLGITAPACIIAGNDKVHTPQAARNLHDALAGSELFDDVVSKRDETDLLDQSDQAEWQAKEPVIVKILTGFVRRHDKLAVKETQ